MYCIQLELKLFQSFQVTVLEFPKERAFLLEGNRTTVHRRDMHMQVASARQLTFEWKLFFAESPRGDRELLPTKISSTQLTLSHAHMC